MRDERSRTNCELVSSGRARYIAAVPDRTRVVAPGPRSRTVRSEDGVVLAVPADWALLPPGDPALTGRVKKAGPCWTVLEKRGRKSFSHGVWAPQTIIESIRDALAHEREDPAYARKLETGRKRRAAEQTVYAENFTEAVVRFLDFASVHAELAARLARAIAAHAVPVGSGTVARTQRIPIERRAEAATIAWLRHATTGYDNLQIPRVKGMRREVRRMLADRSRQLLGRYRRGESIAPTACPLQRALQQTQQLGAT
jgi:hypothetical protein